MRSLHKDQRGVGTLEIILIIAIVAIVGVVGWYVWHTKRNSDKSLDQATSTSQNAGPHFAKPDQSKAKKPSGNSSQPAAASSSSAPQ